MSHNWLESVDSVITVLRQLEIINMSHNNDPDLLARELGKTLCDER